jgi:hypothetical protein
MDHPAYNVNLWATSLDIGALMGNDTLSSNINLQASITGREFDPELITAEAEIHTFPFTVPGSLHLTHYWQESGTIMKTCRLTPCGFKRKSVTAEAKGNYSLNAHSDLHVNLTFDGIEEFADFIPVKDLSTSGNLEAHVTRKARLT